MAELSGLTDTVTIQGVAHPIAEDDSYNGLLMKLSDMNGAMKPEYIANAYVADSHGRRIGRVASLFKDHLNRLHAVLEMSAKQNPELVRKLESGEYRGLSLQLKHLVDPETHEVLDKEVIEVSICEEGDLPGTKIYAVRRDNKPEIIKDHEALDDKLRRERRVLPILTCASKDGGLSRPFTLHRFPLQYVTRGSGTESDKILEPSDPRTMSDQEAATGDVPMSAEQKRNLLALLSSPGILKQLGVDIPSKAKAKDIPAPKPTATPLSDISGGQIVTSTELMEMAARVMKESMDQSVAGFNRNAATDPGNDATEAPSENEAEESPADAATEDGDTSMKEPADEDDTEVDVFKKSHVENLKKMRGQLEERNKVQAKEMEEMRKALDDKEAEQTKLYQALKLLGTASNVEEFHKKATEQYEKKIRHGQKKIAEAQKLAMALLSEDKRDGGEESETEMSARTAALEAFRRAAEETDVKKAEAMLEQQRGMVAVTTKASKKIGALNGQISEMEIAYQKLQKDNEDLRRGSKRPRDKPAYSEDSSSIMSPSGLAKEAAQSFLGNTEEGGDSSPTEDAIKQKAIELKTFASSTWKKYSTEDDSLGRKKRCPFNRRSFGEMIPLGEAIDTQYSYNLTDHFGWDGTWGRPNGREVLSRCFSGGMVSKTLEDEDYERLDELYPEMPRTRDYTPYTNDQAKIFGVRTAE